MSKRKKNAPDPNLLFGELRAILQHGALTQGHTIQIWSLCIRMHKHHAKLYHSQWLPYLKDYAYSWLPERIVLTSTRELEQAAAILPFARFTLRLHDLDEDLERSDKHSTLHQLRPHLIEHIDALDLTSYAFLDRILDAPQLHTLGSLHITPAPYNVVDVLERLHRSPHAASLKELHICHGTAHENYRAGKLMEHAFPSLHNLSLRHSQLGDIGLKPLIEAHIFAHLTSLDLAYTGINDFMLDQLAHASHFGALTHLDLSGLETNRRRFSALIALLTSPHHATLTHLSLRESFAHFKPIALLEALGAHPQNHIESLDLSGNDPGIMALRKLAKSKHFERLRTLSLLDVPLNTAQIELLATHPFFSRLEALQVHPYQLDARQADVLATSATLHPHLTAQFASWTPHRTTWPYIST